MLNKIWFWLLLIGILYGFGKGLYRTLDDRDPSRSSAAVNSPPHAAEVPVPKPQSSGLPEVTADRRNLIAMGKDLNAAALDAAKVSVEICIGLIGIMALWLGLLRIAQDAGMVDALAWCLRPVTRWLFPDVPDHHPAQGAILMNFAANMLGLENAATPLGLKAMRELQTLNPTTDTATNAMATFLAINTSSITLIPFTIIGYRVAAGSTNPAGPIVGMTLATTASTLVAIIAVRWLSRWKTFAASEPRVVAAHIAKSASDSPDPGNVSNP